MKKALFLIIAAFAVITVSCTKETLNTKPLAPSNISVTDETASAPGVLLATANPDADLFTVFYGYTDGAHLEGTGAIDMTVTALEVVANDKSKYHLLYAQGILRNIDDDSYSETIWSTKAPKINWSKPNFTELPYFLHYRKAFRTDEVDFNKIAGHATDDFYQTVEIYYIDTTGKVCLTELNWDEMNTVQQIEIETSNR